MISNDELTFEVGFMSCVIDKADNLVVKESDSHFCEFVGVHNSKIKQGKLFLHDVIPPQDRENIMKLLCKKNSPYIYFDMYLKNKDDRYIFVHCTGQNVEDSTLCRLTMADVSQSEQKTARLKAKAKEMNHLIDLVTGGVCLFKVSQNMHFSALYMNEACCRFFGTTKDSYKKEKHRLDELIHPEDKSLVFQAIGNTMATKTPIDLEIRIKSHKDSYIWCKMNSAIQRYDDDNCPIFHAIFTNITKVKNEEQEADRQNELMVKIFKNLPGPVFTADIDDPFKLDIVSSDFMKLIGYTRKEFFEKLDGDLSRLISDKDVIAAKNALLMQSKSSNSINATYTLTTKKGAVLSLVDRRKVVDGDNGEKSTFGILSELSTLHLDGGLDI